MSFLDDIASMKFTSFYLGKDNNGDNLMQTWMFPTKAFTNLFSNAILVLNLVTWLPTYSDTLGNS